MYEQKNTSYFSFVRRDIEPLLPENCDAVLELGCGGGATLAWLKESGRAQHTTGLELCAAPAAAARRRVDRVIEGDLDRTMGELPREHYDLVLCLDVLEHLTDPWAAVRRVHELLRPGGSVIVSLPNVRHYSVVLPLLFSGKWRYEQAGIMDRTHLRFFSRAGALELLSDNGFAPSASVDNGVAATRRRELWKPLVARTRWRDLIVHQHLVRAEKLVRSDLRDAHCSLQVQAA